jgi:hypothetical protein
MKNFLALTLFAAICTLNGCSQQQNTVALFDGHDLNNWNFVVEGDTTPPEQVFSVADGAILIQGTPFGYMYTKEKYSNFTLHAAWRWVNEPSNSGIFLLISNPANPFPTAIECQLHAGDAGDFVLLNGAELNEYVQPAGADRPKFPVVKKQHDSSEVPTGQWNKAVIHVNDGRIKVFVNDVLQNEGTSPVKEGYIGLQSEGKQVQFQNVTITPLGDK